MYFDTLTFIALAFLVLFLVVGGFAVYGAYCLYQKRRGRLHSVPLTQNAPALPKDAPDSPVSSVENAGESGGPSPAASPGMNASAPSAERWTNPHALSDFYVRSMKKGSPKQSLLLRCCIIAVITLALLVPLNFVSGLVHERSSLQRGAVSKIAQSWGSSQTVSGPALVVPYEIRRTVTDEITDEESGKTRKVSRWENLMQHKVVLPTKLEFDAVLEPQTRYYGIYEYVVYTAPVALRGAFRLPPAPAFDDQLVCVHWEKAWFALGITDLKAIGQVDALLWNGKPAAPFSPNTRADNLLGPGFHAPVPLDPSAPEPVFSLDIRFNGSGGLYFTPVGETTRIDVRGDWNSPHFGGGLLPESRTITDTNFKASWSIPHLSRTYPQVGDLGASEFKITSSTYRGNAEESGHLSRFVAGVDLYEPVSLYRQVDRAVKYGLLFIGLTFVALLSFELASQSRLHLMQYCLVGIAMTLFYLVLLSLAEYTAFLTAFLTASAVSIGMNGMYIAAALRSKGKGAVIMALLAGLYAVLYALLQMEDYALLVGTALVLIVVGVLMVLTRNLPVTGRPEEGNRDE